jgi:hypothetical protein
LPADGASRYYFRAEFRRDRGWVVRAELKHEFRKIVCRRSQNSCSADPFILKHTHGFLALGFQSSNFNHDFVEPAAIRRKVQTTMGDRVPDVIHELI